MYCKECGGLSDGWLRLMMVRWLALLSSCINELPRGGKQVSFQEAKSFSLPLTLGSSRSLLGFLFRHHFSLHLKATMKLLLASLLASATAFSPSITTPQHSLSATRLEARKPFISGNWKLNPSTKDEALALGKQIAASITADTPDVDVALFVPYVFIESTMGVVDGKLSIGAEVRLYS